MADHDQPLEESEEGPTAENPSEESPTEETPAVGTDEAAGTQPDENDGTAAATQGRSRAQGKTVAAALGEVTWLLTQSQSHRYALFVADLEWLVMPALQTGQYRLFYNEGKPAGLAVWAYASDGAETRLASGSRLAVTEWRSGPNLWLVELIAPFGAQEAMLKDLRKTVFAGKKFKFLRTHPDGKRETVEMPASEPPDDEA